MLVSARIRPIVGMADVHGKAERFGLPDDRIVPNTSASPTTVSVRGEG